MADRTGIGVGEVRASSDRSMVGRTPSEGVPIEGVMSRDRPGRREIRLHEIVGKEL